LVTIAITISLVAALNGFLYGREASSHTSSSYAYIEENSVGSYTGVVGSVDFQNPDLGTASFTNATVWIADNYACGGPSWIEGGWSKRASWGGQARHKFMHKASPNCVFTIWPFNIGSPAAGPFYEYALCTTPAITGGSTT